MPTFIRKKNIVLTLGMAAALSLATGCGDHQTSGLIPQAQATADSSQESVLSINSVQITQKTLNRLAQSGLGVDQLIRQEMLSQEAQKNGFETVKVYKQALEQFRRQALSELFVQKFLEGNPASDEEIATKYDEYLKYSNFTEYSVKIGVIDSKKEAAQIISRLNGDDEGQKSKALASLKLLRDQKGNDVQWSRIEALPTFVSKLAPQLAKGKSIDRPIPTADGFVVVYLEDAREYEKPPLDEVRNLLVAQVQNNKVNSLVSNLRKSAVLQFK